MTAADTMGIGALKVKTEGSEALRRSRGSGAVVGGKIRRVDASADAVRADGEGEIGTCSVCHQHQRVERSVESSAFIPNLPYSPMLLHKRAFHQDVVK